MKSPYFNTLGMIFGTGLVLAISSPAMADTAQANLEVTATVQPACAIETFPVEFGVLNAADPAASYEATGVLRITCTRGTSWTAVPGAGNQSNNSSGSPARNMWSANLHNGATWVLPYTLYNDEAHTIPFTADSPFSGVGNGGATTKFVYGQLLRSSAFTYPDDYSDSIVISVEY